MQDGVSLQFVAVVALISMIILLLQMIASFRRGSFFALFQNLSSSVRGPLIWVDPLSPRKMYLLSQLVADNLCCDMQTVQMILLFADGW
jgi:hypothetical protein